LAYPKWSVKILSMQVLLTSGIISQSSRTVALRSFSIVSSTFAIVSSETDGRPERCSYLNRVCLSYSGNFEGNMFTYFFVFWFCIGRVLAKGRTPIRGVLRNAYMGLFQRLFCELEEPREPNLSKWKKMKFTICYIIWTRELNELL
jgi:hypothetical protein